MNDAVVKQIVALYHTQGEQAAKKAIGELFGASAIGNENQLLQDALMRDYQNFQKEMGWL